MTPLPSPHPKWPNPTRSQDNPRVIIKGPKIWPIWPPPPPTHTHKKSGYGWMSKWGKNTIIVVACPDGGAGIDPEALGLAIHQGPTFINAYNIYLLHGRACNNSAMLQVIPFNQYFVILGATLRKFAQDFLKKLNECSFSALVTAFNHIYFTRLLILK